MAGNPRIDDLRKRLDRDPGSRLFAQLAEELRKDGELEEAIRVCRQGLQKHPAYPSARMTLGRALLDTGADASVVPLRYIQPLGVQIDDRMYVRSPWGGRRTVYTFLQDVEVG